MSPQEPRFGDTRQAILALGTELQSKQAPQKLRAWGDGGKKLTPTATNRGQPCSGCQPGSTGRSLPPGSRPAPRHPHRNGRLSTLQTETPPKGTARRAKAPVPGHLSKFRGATGLEGKLVP